MNEESDIDCSAFHRRLEENARDCICGSNVYAAPRENFYFAVQVVPRV
jgi:hypothetical protein